MPLVSADLPTPGDDALAHSAKLAAHIRAVIEAAGGTIAFSEYMREALYAPELGYYRAGTTKFGAAGDFVTAPEISPLFGQTIARQIGATLSACQGDTVLELGAGSGRLALDMLRTFASENCLPKRYLILEVSAELAARQRELLSSEPELATRVEWLARLPEQPIRGVIFANEVADALPVERFFQSSDGLHRRGVAVEQDCFAWRDLAADPETERRLRSLAKDYGWSAPYESEFCPALVPWVRALADALEGGMLLLFDYGLPEREYYHAQRDMGTMLCHYRHRAHEGPFLWPGLCDITAWVDFSALAQAGKDAGLEIGGYTTQANFLVGGGIGEAINRAGDEQERLRLSGEIKRLVLPSEMGEAFKTIALMRDCPAPAAFDFHNIAARL